MGVKLMRAGAGARHPAEDHARAMVQWALSERGGVSGSVFELFSGKGAGQNSSKRAHSRRPPRRIESSGGGEIPAPDLGGISPTRVHAVESERQRKASIPIASGRSGADIKRAIATLAALQQQWVHYCYNPSGFRKQEALRVLGPRVWEEVKTRHLAKARGPTLIIVNHMVRLQLGHARSYPAFCRWRPGRPVELEHAINREAWKDTYSRYWKAVHATLEEIDAEAMQGVYAKVVGKRT